MSKQVYRRFLAALLVLYASVLWAENNDFITEEGFVSVPGGKIWYQVISTEKTKHQIPLLLLHGGPGFPHNYLNVFKTLAHDRPVIFYDQLGCGRSPATQADTTLWVASRFLLELEILVQHLHLHKFHLFGHSWGGSLATLYAAKHQQQLASLTLASPLLSAESWIADAKQLLSQLPEQTQQIINTNEQQGTTDSPDYLQAVDVYYHTFVCRIDPWPQDLTDSLALAGMDVYHTMWGNSEFVGTGNLKDFNQMPVLPTLHIPVLITGGKYDEAREETLTNAVKQLTLGQLIIYKNSSHMAFLEEQDKYLQDLRQFLSLKRYQR